MAAQASSFDALARVIVVPPGLGYGDFGQSSSTRSSSASPYAQASAGNEFSSVAPLTVGAFALGDAQPVHGGSYAQGDAQTSATWAWQSSEAVSTSVTFVVECHADSSLWGDSPAAYANASVVITAPDGVHTFNQNDTFTYYLPDTLFGSALFTIITTAEGQASSHHDDPLTPEPGSLMALGLGTVAFARRRVRRMPVC
ncbi:MAG: PEP-CTERM sorting domain-containing protein [Fimbriimonas sp.]